VEEGQETPQGLIPAMVLPAEQERPRSPNSQPSPLRWLPATSLRHAADEPAVPGSRVLESPRAQVAQGPRSHPALAHLRSWGHSTWGPRVARDVMKSRSGAWRAGHEASVVQNLVVSALLGEGSWVVRWLVYLYTSPLGLLLDAAQFAAVVLTYLGLLRIIPRKFEMAAYPIWLIVSLHLGMLDVRVIMELIRHFEYHFVATNFLVLMVTVNMAWWTAPFDERCAVVALCASCIPGLYADAYVLRRRRAVWGLLLGTGTLMVLSLGAWRRLFEYLDYDLGLFWGE
jgi:hypothetical protein